MLGLLVPALLVLQAAAGGSGATAGDGALPARASMAQDTAPARWSVGVVHREEWTRAATEALRLTRLNVLRRVGRGAVVTELHRAGAPVAPRYGAGVELYAPLWRMSEGYVQVASSPGSRRMPRLQAGGELVQHLSPQWHGSIGFEHRSYEYLDVRRVLVGGGWSHPGWFVRARVGVIHADEYFTTGHVIVRKLIGGGPNLLEAVVSGGGDVIDVRPGAGAGTPLIGWGGGAAVRAEIDVARGLAVTLGAGHGALGRFGARTHVLSGLTVRW
jgi:YaiO family outer membrane protein